jgi:hypothetical protein
MRMTTVECYDEDAVLSDEALVFLTAGPVHRLKPTTRVQFYAYASSPRTEQLTPGVA